MTARARPSRCCRGSRPGRCSALRAGEAVRWASPPARDDQGAGKRPSPARRPGPIASHAFRPPARFPCKSTAAEFTNPTRSAVTFDVRVWKQWAVERGRARSGWSVASMRSMRWRLAHRSSSRSENARPRRAAPHRQRVRGAPRLVGGALGKLVGSCDPAGLPVLRRLAPLDPVALQAVCRWLA